jgi:SAM-dependent methyltransferase
LAAETIAGQRGYKEVNRLGWDVLARRGSDSSTPYGQREFARAADCLDPNRWLPWRQIRSVLCLAAGGGQQGPLFASLGREVTVLDLSPEQLRLDANVAQGRRLRIDCIEADMLDLSILDGRRFDLVYQPVSAIYVPSVRDLYREVASVVGPGGYYWVEHWNPVQLQTEIPPSWDGKGYRLVRPQLSGVALPWVSDESDGRTPASCWHFMHSLQDLIGGLCDAGFVMLRFAERADPDAAAPPGSYQHFAHYIPSFFTMLARRRADVRPHPDPRPAR